MKRILGLLLLLLTTSAGWAAPTTIKGTVVGGDDGQPIIGAYVIINASAPDAAKRTSLTGTGGTFQVTSKEATVNVTISFIGYKNYYEEITPTGKIIDLGTIRLVPEAQVTETVTVTAKAPMAVVKGDTLWGIAEKYLGSGVRYKEIKTLNGLDSDTIYSGQKLKIPN